jgi:hypothetical protein
MPGSLCLTQHRPWVWALFPLPDGKPHNAGALKGRDIKFSLVRYDYLLRPFRACFSLFIHSQGVALG